MSQAPRPDLRPARRRLPAKDMDDPEAYRGNTVGENRTAKRHRSNPTTKSPRCLRRAPCGRRCRRQQDLPGEQRGDGWRSMKVPRSFNPTTRNYVDGSAHAAPPLGNERAGADAVFRELESSLYYLYYHVPEIKILNSTNPRRNGHPCGSGRTRRG